MPLHYIGKHVGFAQRTHTEIRATPFLPQNFAPKDLWRSPVTQKKILEDLLEFNNDTKRPQDLELQLAIMEARHAFNIPGKVKMLHLNDVFKQDLDIWARSPGLPWKDLGYKTKGDIKKDPDAVQSVRRFWHLVKYGKKVQPPDCCAFVRSHICNVGEYKVRGIWGYPATLTFGEAVFALPLIRAYQARQYPMAYGYETAIGGAAKVLKEFRGFEHFTALDFSSFDKTVPAWLIQVAFAILADNIDFREYEDYGVADALRNYTMFKYIENYFIRTPIRMANGDRYRKDSGVASGSYFTQLIDSIVNFILIYWFAFKLKVTPQKLIVLGDDSLMATTAPINIFRCAEYAAEIGMRLNFEKSMVTTSLSDVKFLGYTINDGRPSKEREDWLAALVFPENPDRLWDDVASRALGLLYANSGVDSYFDGMLRRIIGVRQFDLRISISMQRMLKHIGVERLDPGKDPPTLLEFLRRLKVI